MVNAAGLDAGAEVVVSCRFSGFSVSRDRTDPLPPLLPFTEPIANRGFGHEAPEDRESKATEPSRRRSPA